MPLGVAQAMNVLRESLLESPTGLRLWREDMMAVLISEGVVRTGAEMVVNRYMREMLSIDEKGNDLETATPGVVTGC